MPTVMTRFTSDSALREIDQKYMRQNMLAVIIAMVHTMTAAVHMLKPSRNIVMTNIDAKLTRRLKTVFLTMVRYCS